MQKVRLQVTAAAASGANTLIYGRPGSGRGHVARAIHYSAANSGDAKLVPIECALLTDEQLRRALDGLRGDRSNPSQRPTLLLENLERISPAHQSVVLNAIRQNALSARIIATCNEDAPTISAVAERADSDNPHAAEVADNARILAGLIDPALLSAISTITIDIPPLVERLEDLPFLAQHSLETCNKGSDKQVGGVRSDALDMLALYSWPGELAQLRDVIRAAHGACASYEIVPGNLPAVVHHAASAAERMRRPPGRIVLDDLLAAIEKEAIVRALAQAGGNKSEAAELLGMTRPRLYRRLVQLGLAGTEGEEPQPEQPEFIERDPAE